MKGKKGVVVQTIEWLLAAAFIVLAVLLVNQINAFPVKNSYYIF